MIFALVEQMTKFKPGKSLVKSLIINDTIKTDPDEINRMAKNFYKSLYSDSQY